MQQRSVMRSGSGLSNVSSRVSQTVPNWVQESARNRRSCTPGSSHRSQTAHPGYDPGTQFGWAFSLSRSFTRDSLRSLRPPPPPISALSTTMSKQRQSCVFRKQHRQQTKPGCKLFRDSRDQAPQTRPLHPWNIPAPPLKSRTATTWTSQRPEEPSQCGAAPSAAFTTH